MKRKLPQRNIIKTPLWISFHKFHIVVGCLMYVCVCVWGRDWEKLALISLYSWASALLYISSLLFDALVSDSIYISLVINFTKKWKPSHRNWVTGNCKLTKRCAVCWNIIKDFSVLVFFSFYSLHNISPSFFSFITTWMRLKAAVATVTACQPPCWFFSKHFNCFLLKILFSSCKLILCAGRNGEYSWEKV